MFVAICSFAGFFCCQFKVTGIHLSGGQLSVICLFMLLHLEQAEAFVPQQTASCRVLVSTAAVYGDQYVLLGC